GYDNTLGFLEGGFDTWVASGKDIETLESISAEAYSKRIKNKDLNVLDVRKEAEYKSTHLKGTNVQHFALDYINDNMNAISKDKTYYVHCGGGYRSAIAASILKARGFNNLIDISGGIEALKKADAPLTDFVCPTSI